LKSNRIVIKFTINLFFNKYCICFFLFWQRNVYNIIVAVDKTEMWGKHNDRLVCRFHRCVYLKTRIFVLVHKAGHNNNIHTAYNYGNWSEKLTICLTRRFWTRLVLSKRCIGIQLIMNYMHMMHNRYLMIFTYLSFSQTTLECSLSFC